MFHAEADYYMFYNMFMDLSKLNGICIAEEGYVLASVAVGV